MLIRRLSKKNRIIETTGKYHKRALHRILTLVFLLSFAVLGGGLLYTSHAAAPTDERILSTLYAYPTESSWQQIEQSAPTVKYAIVNICAPDGTGPGCSGGPATALNPDWPPTISALEKAGITPLYYISTNYGKNAISSLESELNQSINWYGVASPHWDTMQPDGTCDNGGNPIPCTTYNQDLYNYALSKGATAVMFNPGTTYGVSTSDMFGSKEIIEVFEGTAASFESTSFPSWMSAYAPNQFVVTLSAGSSSTINSDVSDAVHDNIGNIYEDDESEPPSYSTLPSFWSSEVKDVAAYSSSTVPSSPTPGLAPSLTAETPTGNSGNMANNSKITVSTRTQPTPIVKRSNNKIVPVTKSITAAMPLVESSSGNTASSGHTLNPFVRIRDVLFKNYKGSTLVPNVGTAVVLLLPIVAVIYLLRVRLVVLLVRIIKRIRT